MKPTIVLSASQRRPVSLVKKITWIFQDHGVDVFHTPLDWPRDELFFLPTGEYDYVQRGTIQEKWSDNFAWHGGTYLKGDGFLLSSMLESNIEREQKTKLLCKVDDIYYLNVLPAMASMHDVAPFSQPNFFVNNTHIDVLVGVSNTVRTFFAYDEPRLLSRLENVADTVGYDIVPIPKSEARYAAINFVESSGVLFVDGRAKKTKNIVRNYGVQVASVPGLDTANKHYGGLCCMTTACPVDKKYALHSDIKSSALHLVGVPEYSFFGKKRLLKSW